MKLHWWKKYQ